MIGRKRRDGKSVKVLVPYGPGNPESVYWITAQRARELHQAGMTERVERNDGKTGLIVRVIPEFVAEFRKQQREEFLASQGAERPVGWTAVSGGMKMNGSLIK